MTRAPVSSAPRVPDRRDDGLRRALAGLGLGALAILVLVVAAPSLDPSYPDRPVGAQAAAVVEELDPEGSRPGGCVALPPTAPGNGRTVLLDPGHGAPDIGSTGTTSRGEAFDEKDVTLPIALAAADDLREQGYRVALTRTTDEVGVRLDDDDLTAGALSFDGMRTQLSARADCANRAGADALVSVHFNAFDDPSVGGVETLFDGSRSFADENERLATALQDSMLRAYRELGQPIEDRGVVGGGSGATAADDLTILAPSPAGSGQAQSEMPGAVVEPLFITAPEQGDLVTSERGQEALASAIAAGADAFLRDAARP